MKKPQVNPHIPIIRQGHHCAGQGDQSREREQTGGAT